MLRVRSESIEATAGHSFGGRIRSISLSLCFAVGSYFRRRLTLYVGIVDSPFLVTSLDHSTTIMPPSDSLGPLQPPTLPFAPSTSYGSPASSPRSSIAQGERVHSMTSISSDPRADVSLSVNYLPAKYTALHEPGQYAHRRGSFFSRTSMADEVSVDDKEPKFPPPQRAESPARARLSRFFPSSLAHKTIPRGGGRDAFASDAGRMGGEEEEGDEVLAGAGQGVAPGEGLRQRRGKGTRFAEGVKPVEERGERRKPSARLVWNRFKWCIFFANLLVSVTPQSSI